MNTITVTVELCAEDRARLDNILAAVQNIGTPYPAPKAIQEAPKAIQEAPEKPQEAPKAEVVEIPAPEAEKPAQAEEPAPAITLDMIRQKVTQLMAAGAEKKDGARDVVKSYAPNITGLGEMPDKWPEIWAKLTALEG